MIVRMIRDEAYPEPRTADVHPDEVEAFRVGGWVPADPLDHDGNGTKGGSRAKPRRKKTDDGE